MDLLRKRKKLSALEITGIIIISFLYGVVSFHFYRKYSADLSKQMLFRRLFYSLLIFLFFLLHFLVDVKKMYAFIFKYRLGIAICIFVFLVANNINFSSMTMFDTYIQPGMGNAFVHPVFGEPREIRSDEWLVNVSRLMSGGYNHYGTTNHILRATSANNLTASGYQLGYWILTKPASWGYYLFGSSYGLSYEWAFYMVFGTLAAFELVYVLTDRKDISLLGAALIQFSPFNLWWSMVSILLAGNATVALFSHFIKEQRIAKKIIYVFFMGCFFSNFVVSLYPAWQVPFGYFYLALAIYIIIKNWNIIKKASHRDYVLLVICIFFCASVIISYLVELRPYIEAITKTTYPGARREYGGFYLNKLFGYMTSLFDFAFKRGNPCEPATFVSLFPLGFILAIYIQIKERGKDIFIWIVSIPSLILFWYCTFGMPEVIAKLFLMSYSVGNRAVDAIAFISVILLLYAISKMSQYGLPSAIAIVLPFIVLTPAVFCSIKDTEVSEKEVALIIITAIIIGVMVSASIMKKGYSQSQQENAESNNIERTSFVAILSALLLIFVGLQVHPIMIGLNAITSKPAYSEIRKIVSSDSEAKWVGVGGGIVLPDYLVACGAPTYNSVNYIPNMEFWHIVDPQGNYENIYNRYAHIALNISDDDDSSIKLVQPDIISINTNYAMLKKLNVSYIASNSQLTSDSVIQLYEENGFYIYELRK